LPSLQAVPFGFAGSEQSPDAGLHVPPSWHGSVAAHTTGLSPRQVPERHLSVRVQALPSLQTLPSALAGFVHAPVAMSQAPGRWQSSDAVQTTGLPPVQTPP
jgi:hypothetical protein